MEIRVSTGHTPRPQQRFLHDAEGRFKVLVTHRRFGKTVFCVNELISRARRCRLRDPRFAYLAPFHIQAKDVAWSYLKHYTAAIPDIRINESELWVELPPRKGHANGARIRLYGADNADRLRGLYFDGVVLDEYAQMHPGVWSEVVRPALSDRLGWAIFIGTPMGRNGFCDLYEGATQGFPQADGTLRKDADWAGFLFKASETGIIPEAELAAARRAMSADQYAQEFECSFDAAIPGAYYAQALSEAEQLGRIRPIPHEPSLAVHTGWDLGIGDPLPADTLEGGFDRAVMRDQQLQDGLDRAVTLPVTSAPSVSTVLPDPQSDTFLGWNSAGNALTNKTLPAGAAVYSSVANTNLGLATAEAVTPASLAGSRFNPAGKHMIPVLATGMQPATTNGAAFGTVETTTNKVLYRTLDFDTTTQEFAGFVLPWPKSADEGTISFRALWTAASGSGGVVWALQALGRSDDDAIDVAYGTEQAVVDTVLAAGDVHRSNESAAITVSTLIEGDLVFLRVKRNPSDAADTLGVDARLLGLEIYLTTNAGTDA